LIVRKSSLHWQILAALVLGVAAGLVWPQGTRLPGGLHPYAVFDFLGVIFLRALKMVIVPLLAGSIISGIAGVGASRGLGRLFTKTFAWYVTTSLAAILIGLLMVNLIRPGESGGVAVGERMGLSEAAPALATDLAGHGAGDFVLILQRMVPSNPVAAAAAGQMLPLIFFCLLLGIAITTLPARQQEAQLGFWESLFQAMMKITGWVIATAPLGIFGLMAQTTASSGFAAFAPLARYGLTVITALVLHGAIVLPLMLKLGGRLSPLRHARIMAPVLLTAFTTRSSSATLPLTMDAVENKAGVSNRVTSFVLPLGSTINMDGTALYECVAAMFIAQAYGVHLGLGAQLVVVFTALLASIGAAGIPAAGLVMISVILEAVGLPLEGLALILAIDPILDMCRTAVNVWSDSCGAVFVARSEGESNVLARTGAGETFSHDLRR
jgi:Na+/H+-dicarboxylate symporter